MRILLLAGVTLALLTAVNCAPAMAQGQKPSDNNAWPGISQRVTPALQMRPLQPRITNTSTDTTSTGHGEGIGS